MGKSIYLLVLYVIILGFWNIKPLGYLNGDIFFVLALFYMFAGVVMYGGFSLKRVANRLKPWMLIVFGIFLSMIPAYLYSGQSITQSIISYRQQIMWLSVPFLFFISPSRKDIVRSSMGLAVIVLGVGLFRLIFPSAFVLSDKEEMLYARGDFEIALEGFQYAIVPFVLYLDKLSHRFSLRTFSVLILLIVMFLIFQNRSLLFTAMVLFLFAMLQIKGNNRWFFIAAILVVLVGGLYFTRDIWVSLVDETGDQLGNDSYNRTKAFVYFLSPLANSSAVTYLLGNGFLSAHSSPVMQELMEQGIYNSDVGFVGFWNQFGVIPIFCFLYLLLMPFWSRRWFIEKRIRINNRKIVSEFCRCRHSSFFIKLFALYLLATSVTIGYYGGVGTMMLFAIYYYLLYSEKYPQNK